MPVYFKQPQRDREWGNGRAGEEAASCRKPKWEYANVKLLDGISEQESNIFVLQHFVEIILAGNSGGIKTMTRFLKGHIKKLYGSIHVYLLI